MLPEIENFVRYSIRAQLLLAQQVAHACDTRIYVFDTSGYFKPSDVTTEVIENVRTISKDGHRAVLSIAVQEAFGTNEDLFLKFADIGVLQEDDIGLYVIAPKIVELVKDEVKIVPIEEEKNEAKIVPIEEEQEDSKTKVVVGDDLNDISNVSKKLESIL